MFNQCFTCNSVKHLNKNTMDIQIFSDGKNTVKHYTENGKHIVKVENTKTKNAVFYRGGSRERAKKMFSDLAKSIQNKIFD